MPRLIVPSIGGGTKLIRTSLEGETDGACAEAGDGATDSPGEGEEIGVGDSCAEAIEAKIANRNAKLTLVVMSSEVSRCCGIIFLRGY